MVDDTRLLLLAQEPDEVPLISALLQDAIVRPADIAYDPRARRLVLLLHRYRWEGKDRTRVRAALRIESITRLQQRGWTDFRPNDPGTGLLSLLAFVVEGNVLTIAFAANATLRIEVECVDLVLEDIGQPWTATAQPNHQ